MFLLVLQELLKDASDPLSAWLDSQVHVFKLIRAQDLEFSLSRFSHIYILVFQN